MSDTPSNEIPTSILTQELPEVQVQVDEHIEEDNIKVASGEEFNSDIHLSDAEGNPVLTKTGKFRKKNKSQRLKDEEIKKQQQQTESTKAAARAATMLTIQGGIMLGGDAGYPVKDIKNNIDEEHHLYYSFDKYFQEKGISDFPPGVALVLAVGQYYGRVLMSEKGSTKAKLSFYWFKDKWAKFRNKRKKAKEHGARNDSGDNRVGQDNPSNEESPRIQD